MKILRILMGISLYMVSVVSAGKIYESLQYTQILLDHPVLGADVQQIQQQEWNTEEPVGFCFWGQAQKQLVTCQDTAGAATVTPVFLAGNPELLDAGSLAWQNGCLVDQKTAEALFGTASVGRQVLWFQDNPLPVLGIAAASRPTIVRMAEPETELDRVVLALPPEQGSVEGQQCLIRWGIQGRVLDSTLTWSLIQNSLLLFPLILVSLLCAYLGRGWRKVSWEGVLYGGQRQLLGKLALCAVLFAAAMWVLGSHVMIPRSMIPTKWSDFSFWQRWWQSQRENMIACLFAPMGNIQLQMAVNMVKSVVTNLCACLVLLWPVRRQIE